MGEFGPRATPNPGRRKYCKRGDHWTTADQFGREKRALDGLQTSCREHQKQRLVGVVSKNRYPMHFEVAGRVYYRIWDNKFARHSHEWRSDQTNAYFVLIGEVWEYHAMGQVSRGFSPTEAHEASLRIT